VRRFASCLLRIAAQIKLVAIILAAVLPPCKLAKLKNKIRA